MATALVATALPGTADASTYLVTFQGVVADGYDLTGLFGGDPAVTTDIEEGTAFTAMFTLNDPSPGSLVETDGTTFYRSYGGTNYGLGVPGPLSATLTINGITQSIAGNTLGIVYKANNLNGYDEFLYDAEDTVQDSLDFVDDYLQIYGFSNLNNIFDSVNLGDPVNYAFGADDALTGTFQFSRSDEGTGNYSRFAYGSLRPQSITIAPLESAVPEPATWALMLVGFGLIGGAMRRQCAAARATIRFA